MRGFLILWLVLSLSQDSVASGQKDEVGFLEPIWTADSLSIERRIRLLDSITVKLVFASPQEAIRLSHIHSGLALEHGMGQELVNAYNNRAFAYLVKGKIDSASGTLELALAVSDTMPDPFVKAKLLTNLGSLERESGNFQKALDRYYKGLEVSEQIDDIPFKAGLLGNIGLVFDEIGERDIAFNYLDSARTFYEESGELTDIGVIWGAMSSIHLRQQRFDEAMALSRKSIALFRSQNNGISTAEAYARVGRIYEQTERPDSALIYADQSLEIYRGLENIDRICEVLALLIDVHLTTADERVFEVADELRSSLPLLSRHQVIADAYDALSRVAKRQQNSKEALKMKELHLLYTDSLNLEEQRTEIVRKEVLIAHEREMERQGEKEQFERQQLKTNQQKRVLTIISVGLVIIALLLLFVFRIRRNSLEQRSKMLEEIDELRSAIKIGNENSSAFNHPNSDTLPIHRQRIETSIGMKLHDTDWKVLELLASDPVMSNQELAEKVFRSIHAVGASLRRMYVYFEIKESKYKKISLILKAVKISNRNLFTVSDLN